MTEQQTTEPDPTNSNRESAAYRRRLRDTEAERDGLRSTVEAMQRSDAERIASATIKSPAGLWAAGVELSALLDDQGHVDPAKVKAATIEAAERLGLVRSTIGGNPRDRGTRGKPRPAGAKWESAFKA